MVGLLSRVFYQRPRGCEKTQRYVSLYGVLCGTVGIVLNILLFAGKWLAGFLSGSIAITADAFNNLSDAGSSVITLIGFHLSVKSRIRSILLAMAEWNIFPVCWYLL